MADRLFTTETAHVDVADRASIDALAAAAQLGPLGPLRSDGQPDRLGTMNFRHTVDESSSFAVMDAAIDAGINFFDVALALCAASARHFLGLTCEQSLYNPAVRAVELELIPALRSLGIGLIPYARSAPARRRARNRHRGRHLRRLDAAAHRGAPQPARSL